MHAGKYLPGLIVTFVALPALAQQTTPTPTPAPARIPPPTITTIPGVIPERFSIAPPRATPTPTPAPTPTPTPTPAAAATPVPRAAAPAQTRREPAPQVTQPLPAPVASPTIAAPPPAATPAPQPAPAAVQPQAVPTAAPAPQPAQQSPWLWALLGAGGTTVAGLCGWLFLRRRRPEEEAEVQPSEPVAVAPPPPPVRGPSPAITAPPPVPAANDPFEIALQPLRIQIGEREILIELELTIANRSGASADAVRLSLATISASPRQDAELAAFALTQLPPSAEPFDLAAGGGGRMPVQLIMPREAMHVVDVGGRPMFVPIVAIDVRWRGGLSIRRYAASFMLGGAGQGGKIAPIWLDRGQPRGPFAANRYQPAAAAAA